MILKQRIVPNTQSLHSPRDEHLVQVFSAASASCFAFACGNGRKSLGLCSGLLRWVEPPDGGDVCAFGGLDAAGSGREKSTRVAPMSRGGRGLRSAKMCPHISMLDGERAERYEGEMTTWPSLQRSCPHESGACDLLLKCVFIGESAGTHATQMGFNLVSRVSRQRNSVPSSTMALNRLHSTLFFFAHNHFGIVCAPYQDQRATTDLSERQFLNVTGK